MSWTNARQALLRELRTLGHDVHAVPPQTLDGDGAAIILTPPARTNERRASHIRRTTYRQHIRVLSHIPSEGEGDVEAVANDVDAVVEEITTLLDKHLQLTTPVLDDEGNPMLDDEGNPVLDIPAVSVTAPSWDEMTVIEYPSGSGLSYAMMDGTIAIEVETPTTFRP